MSEAPLGLPALGTIVIDHSFVHLFLGFGTAAGFGPLITDISHWFLRRRGIAVALTASGNYFAGVLWPPLLAGSLTTDGWRDVYILLALITVAVIIPLACLLRRNVPESAHIRAAKQVAKNTAKTSLSPRMLQILLSIAGVSCCVAMSMPQVHIVSYCVGLGYGPAIGAQMLSLMLLGGVISRIVSGMLA